MGTAVIARRHPPPVFEPSEYIFDLMALFIQRFAIGFRSLPTSSRRDTRRDPFRSESGAIFVAVIALITNENSRRLRQSRIEYFRPNMIAGLTFGQAHQDGATPAIDDGMQL